MASLPGRRLANWRTPRGRLLRCVATHLYRGGLRGSRLAAEFRRLVPDCDTVFALVSDTAIHMRGYLGTRPGYERERPDRDPASADAWRRAQRIVERGMPVLFAAATVAPHSTEGVEP